MLRRSLLPVALLAVTLTSVACGANTPVTTTAELGSEAGSGAIVAPSSSAAPTGSTASSPGSTTKPPGTSTTTKPNGGSTSTTRSGGSSTSTPTTRERTTTTRGASTPTTLQPAQPQYADWCGELLDGLIVMDALFKSETTPEDMALAEVKKFFATATANSPQPIAADWQYLNAQVQALSSMSAMSSTDADPKFEETSTRIEEWVLKNCGFDMNEVS